VTRAPSADDRAAAVFDALGDGTRRELFAAVGQAGSATATELAADRPLSRQAVLKHLHVLAAAGLVSSEKVGREQRYSVTPAPLADAVGWMAQVGADWDRRLDRLRGQRPISS